MDSSVRGHIRLRMRQGGIHPLGPPVGMPLSLLLPLTEAPKRLEAKAVELLHSARRGVRLRGLVASTEVLGLLVLWLGLFIKTGSRYVTLAGAAVIFAGALTKVMSQQLLREIESRTARLSTTYTNAFHHWLLAALQLDPYSHSATSAAAHASILRSELATLDAKARDDVATVLRDEFHDLDGHRHTGVAAKMEKTHRIRGELSKWVPTILATAAVRDRSKHLTETMTDVVYYALIVALGVSAFLSVTLSWSNQFLVTIATGVVFFSQWGRDAKTLYLIPPADVISDDESLDDLGQRFLSAHVTAQDIKALSSRWLTVFRRVRRGEDQVSVRVI